MLLNFSVLFFGFVTSWISHVPVSSIFSQKPLGGVGVLRDAADTTEEGDEAGLFNQRIHADFIICPVGRTEERLRRRVPVAVPLDAVLRHHLPQGVSPSVGAAGDLENARLIGKEAGRRARPVRLKIVVVRQREGRGGGGGVASPFPWPVVVVSE